MPGSINPSLWGGVPSKSGLNQSPLKRDSPPLLINQGFCLIRVSRSETNINMVPESFKPRNSGKVSVVIRGSSGKAPALPRPRTARSARRPWHGSRVRGSENPIPSRRLGSRVSRVRPGGGPADVQAFIHLYPAPIFGFQWKTRPLQNDTPLRCLEPGLKTWLVEGPKSIGSLWVLSICCSSA